MRGELRSASTTNLVRYVMTSGTAMMLLWCATSLALGDKVQMMGAGMFRNSSGHSSGTFLQGL